MKQNETPQSESLTPRQHRMISALLAEPTLEAAAKSAGVGRATLWRWLSCAAFASAYAEARRASIKQSMARLQQVSSIAVECLQEVMQGEDTPAAARVSAARAVLDYAMKAVELEDLAGRVEELEKHLEALSAMQGRR